jgi:hypothetical protein
MNFPRPINRRTPSLANLILLMAAGLFLSGCRAPLVNKEWHIVVYQTGVNEFSPEIIKEEDIAPQLKASLK